MKPTKNEIELTVNLLINKYNLSVRFVNILLEDAGCYKQLVNTINKELTLKDKVTLLINQKESILFAGSNERTIELRAKIINSFTPEEIDVLFDKYCKSNGTSKSHKVRKLSQLRWHSGKSWASNFIRTAGFPKIFAGTIADSKAPVIEDIEPFIVPPPLTDFQSQLKENLLSVLNNDGDKTRCIVSLPTGGGKTRTAVEAFIEWLQPKFAKGLYLIWIAQSEELCEQAVECIKQQWSSKQFTEPLRVYRFFGGNNIEESDLIGGIVVSSIQQLYSRLKNKDILLDEIISNTGSIIIDEAHRGTTKMYRQFFNRCQELNNEDLFPICGLTATPGRSFDETSKLVDTFQSKLFTPNIGKEFDKNPLLYFRKQGYLAKPIPKQIRTQTMIEYKGSDYEEFVGIMNSKVLKELANNDTRNKLILNELLSIPKGKQAIVYACTLAHSELISTLLNYNGRTATSISAKTPRHYRRKLIEQFKSGEIDFIINFGVLTTGFDAPKTEYIVICRPTFSEVLYEQIVGRGLRGPKFGGTESCHIIDFCDNYERFGDQQAYNRFKDFWD